MAEPLASRDAFSRAYRRLRSELARAERPAGSAIRIDETAHALAISPTPVREALSRLSGERLVQGCRRQGYFVPKPSQGDLVQLYHLSELHLVAAVNLRDADSMPVPVHSLEDAARFEEDSGIARLLIAILAKSRLPILFDIGVLVVERLAIARRAEICLLDTARERADLVRLLRRPEIGDLEDALRSYHQLRRDRAGEIAQELASGQAGAAEYIPDIV